MKAFSCLAIIAALTTAAPIPREHNAALDSSTLSYNPLSPTTVRKDRLHKRIIILATNLGLGLGGMIGNAAGSGVGKAVGGTAGDIINIFNGGSAPTNSPQDGASTDEVIAALQEATANPQPGVFNVVGGTVGEWFGAEVGKFLTEGLDGSADVPALRHFINAAAAAD